MNIKYYKFQISEIPLEYLIRSLQKANYSDNNVVHFHKIDMEDIEDCCRMQNKVVTMTFSSNYSGQNPKEGTRFNYFYFPNTLNVFFPSELILDEHVECGCQCTPGNLRKWIIMIKIMFILFRGSLQLRRYFR